MDEDGREGIAVEVACTCASFWVYGPSNRKV